jgi:DNA adenine methylase
MLDKWERLVMQYFGGKTRIAPKLAGFMQPFVSGAYVEPFVGSAAVMVKISAPVRIGSDINGALITMWRALAAGWQPPENVSEAEYVAVRAKGDPSDPLTAFVGIGCSFSGKWFGGYARNTRCDNYAIAAAHSLTKKIPKLQGVNWLCSDYRQIDYPPESVIYCDPPYQGTTGYAGAGNDFNGSFFWNFCREKSKSGHRVFISEYAAPDDFKVCLTIETNLEIRNSSNKRMPRIEKLFTPAINLKSIRSLFHGRRFP